MVPLLTEEPKTKEEYSMQDILKEYVPGDFAVGIFKGLRGVPKITPKSYPKMNAFLKFYDLFVLSMLFAKG